MLLASLDGDVAAPEQRQFSLVYLAYVVASLDGDVAAPDEGLSVRTYAYSVRTYAYMPESASLKEHI